MENIVTGIDLAIVDKFRRRFPDLAINEPRVATADIAVEFRRFNVGDIVLFPMSEYNYSSVRAAPASIMGKQMVENGYKWSTTLDYGNKSVAVIRTR